MTNAVAGIVPVGEIIEHGRSRIRPSRFGRGAALRAQLGVDVKRRACCSAPPLIVLLAAAAAIALARPAEPRSSR